MAQEKQPTAEIDFENLTLKLVIPIGEERLSQSEKSIILFTSGFQWIKIPGSNVVYKVQVIRGKNTNSIKADSDEILKASTLKSEKPAPVKKETKYSEDGQPAVEGS